MRAFDAVLDFRLDLYLRERVIGCLLGAPAVAVCAASWLLLPTASPVTTARYLGL
jgi:hypothetical protein